MVDSEPTRKPDILAAHFTYHDVLMMGIANLPPGINTLTADAGKWGEVVEGIKRDFTTKAPELLREVHFSHREPLPPESKQLDNFFFVAGLGGILPPPHPGHLVYDLPEHVKKYIKQRRGPKLVKYTSEIQEMSTHLEALAV